MKHRCGAYQPNTGYYTCSLRPEHGGDHKAYGGHEIDPDHFREAWPNLDVVTDDDVAQAIASIKMTANKTTH